MPTAAGEAGHGGQAPSPSPAATLLARLGLSDAELLEILAADPLSVLGGDLDHRPELSILLALTQEASGQVGDPVLRRWLRAPGPHGRPLDQLLARDFAGFEDALSTLMARGFVLRGGGG